MTAPHLPTASERRRSGRSTRRPGRVALALVVVALLATPGVGLAMDFPNALARVDQGLLKNPSKVSGFALESCRKRRNFAVQLYNSQQFARAERSLKYCFDVLGISENAPVKADSGEPAAPNMEQIQEMAAQELKRALALTPDIENGLELYRTCALCHNAEGSGLSNGLVPQLAGQHRAIVIKQLADFRAGNRDSVLMVPYATMEAIGGAQAVADVSGYIDTLEISVENGKGPGTELELGARIYAEKCARCHGDTGEGNADEYAPRIQAQHFGYLVRQFEWIRDGKRRNANAEMVEQIQAFEEKEINAVLDYVSRLEPPENLQAPPGWRNPDFVERAAK